MFFLEGPKKEESRPLTLAIQDEYDANENLSEIY
jgi:hypothetical protein